MVFLIQIKEKKMKKNFLKIAALLIAAMLLVVSCSQEVKAPENNGLVEARLSVGFGRDLIVNGDTKTGNLKYKYTMVQGWTNPTEGLSEPVIGAANNKEFTDNSPIGYVTPGLWNITVDAYESISNTESGTTTDKKVFTGEASVYFSSQNQSATVYLAPVGDSANSITFSITMQDLSVTPDNFELKYSIYKGSDSSAITNGTGPLSRTGNDTTHVSTYSDTVSNLASGYYRVTVSVYDKIKSKTVGGITKGFLISNGANATIKGHIEPADYENVTIDAVFVDVNTELSVSQVIQEGESPKENALTKTEGKDYYTVIYDGTPVKVTVKMDDKTTTANGLAVSKTLFWNTVSDASETNQKNEIQKANTDSNTFTFSTPGHKYITCTTVYEVTGTSTGMSANKYYYADYQTVHVYVAPANNSK